MRRLAIGMVVAAVVAGHGSASAETPRMKQGRAIAEGRCAFCHAVGASGESPQNGVLPFREFPSRFPIAMLVQSLKTGVVSGHDDMPGTTLDVAQARALLTYIDSLAPPGARYLEPARKK